MSDAKNKKGYFLVCPDFGPSNSSINRDTEVRYLCYIAQHIQEIAAVASDVPFEIISLRWHHVGEPYPCLAIPSDAPGEISRIMCEQPFVIEDQITEYVNRVGLDNLVEFSQGETMTWADVLEKAKQDKDTPYEPIYANGD